MIVAAYTNSTTLWAAVIPVTPVTRIEKYSRQSKDSKRSRQEENAFAALFVSLKKNQEPTASNGFDARV